MIKNPLEVKLEATLREIEDLYRLLSPEDMEALERERKRQKKEAEDKEGKSVAGKLKKFIGGL